MPRNEEGEFELVIGNRQLLSGFFIVVVLFGVLFAMGYIVGRHSSPTGPSTAAAAGTEKPPVAAPSSTGPAAGHADVVMADTKNETPPADGQSPATRPATAPPEAPRPAESRKAETRAAAGPPEPAPGRYLQVAAPNRAAADGVVESLKNKGITARLAPGPNEDTVRVLVGPLDLADVGKMKVDLEGAGFKPFNKTY